jgi:S1-C subfamily serine protease
LHKAGVQKRDMIYEINGHKIDFYGELLWNEDKISIVDYVSQLKLGQEVDLTVYRSGERKELKFIFDQAEFLPIHKIYPGYEDIDYEVFAGMVVQPLTTNHLPLLVNIAPGLTRYAEMKYQMEPALIITHIFPDSQAQRSRSIMPGGILNEVNGIRVKTLDELRKALFKSFETNVVTIETTDSIFVVVPFKKIIEDEKRLSKDYFYPMTQGVKALVEKVEAEEKAQEVVDIKEKE